MVGRLLRALPLAAITAAAASYAQYRKDLAESRERLIRGSAMAATAAGPVEFAERHEGEAMLVIHGAGGGYDQGLLLAEGFDESYRVIAPSRFGYLRTPVPEDSSPAAQADAHAALLDFLGIDKAIVAGASAGAPSAIELALRHPQRVSALILLVPRAYDPVQPVGADESAESQAILEIVERSADFLFWLASHVWRRSVVRFLGVPPRVEARASKDERERVTRIIKSIMPLSQRVRGIEVDSAAEIHPWPLEQIACPVLIASAEDDLYKTPHGARFTASQIQGAELHVFNSGGHLMVGQTGKLRSLVRDFLGRRSPARSGNKAARSVELA
jgi:2-hydroxy-6-oxonona-2,4-dienedioate hydrolase